MNKYATLIYNPVSGSAEISWQIDKFADEWRAAGWDMTIIQTTYAGHAVELAASAAAQGHSIVVAAGGDGTIREVIQGILGTGTVLAILPSGTGNSYARDLRLKADRWRRNRFGRLARRLLNGRVQRMDICRCNDELIWFSCLGVGVDGLAVQAIEPRIYGSALRRRFNTLIYAAKILNTVRKFKGMHATVTVDDETVSGPFFLVTVNNTRRYGGHFIFNPEAVLDDGLVEVWLLRGHRKRTMVANAWRVIVQRQVPDGFNVIRLRGRDVQVQVGEAFPFEWDGDLGGNGGFCSTVERGAQPILVPDEPKVAKLFSIRGEKLTALEKG